MDEMSDEDLMADHLSGNPEAFPLLVTRYTDKVYSYTVRLMGQREDAEDIVQDVFVKVWKNADRFKPGARFTTWMFAIARNTITDYLRKKKSIAFSTFDGEGDSFEDRLASQLPTAEEDALLDEDKELVVRALQLLKPADRDVLMLKYEEDMTYEDIAEMLRIPLNTAKSRGRRALKALKVACTQISPAGVYTDVKI